MKEVNNYSSIPEIGDDYEFCKIMEDGKSHVFYGRIIDIDKNAHSFTFDRLDNGIKKNLIGVIISDVVAVRGIVVDPKTWEEDVDEHSKR